MHWVSWVSESTQLYLAFAPDIQHYPFNIATICQKINSFPSTRRDVFAQFPGCPGQPWSAAFRYPAFSPLSGAAYIVYVCHQYGYGWCTSSKRTRQCVTFAAVFLARRSRRSASSWARVRVNIFALPYYKGLWLFSRSIQFWRFCR